jgi:hypothetical protein
MPRRAFLSRLERTVWPWPAAPRPHFPWGQGSYDVSVLAGCLAGGLLLLVPSVFTLWLVCLAFVWFKRCESRRLWPATVDYARQAATADSDFARNIEGTCAAA